MGNSRGGRKPNDIAFDGAQESIYAFDWISPCQFLLDLDEHLDIHFSNHTTGLVLRGMCTFVFECHFSIG